VLPLRLVKWTVADGPLRLITRVPRLDERRAKNPFQVARPKKRPEFRLRSVKASHVATTKHTRASQDQNSSRNSSWVSVAGNNHNNRWMQTKTQERPQPSRQERNQYYSQSFGMSAFFSRIVDGIPHALSKADQIPPGQIPETTPSELHRSILKKIKHADASFYHDVY
jgi:hypothetical protein